MTVEPEEMGVVLRWMLPHLTPDERAMMLADMRRSAPPPAFEAALALARAQLTPREWDKLARALELAP